MDNKQLLEKITLLEKRITELESLKKNNSNMFGRSYSQIGDSNSDLLLKTKGQVKIQWGSKFIDLIKDGKININSDFIFTSDSIDNLGPKDGLYVINNEIVYLKLGDVSLPLSDNTGTVYVSFLDKQETSADEKYTALQNIGFFYKDIDELKLDTSLKNGIIYIESEEKLYTIKNGTLSEFSITFPSSFSKPFIITNSDTNQRAIVIKGQGIHNSLAFDQMLIYNNDNISYIDSKGKIHLKVGGKDKIIIDPDGIVCIDSCIASTFQSLNANSVQGFRLYFKNGRSTLEIDDLILRGQVNGEISNNNSSSKNIYFTYWWGNNNIIQFAKLSNEFIENENPGEGGSGEGEEGGEGPEKPLPEGGFEPLLNIEFPFLKSEYILDLAYENTYKKGDYLYTYITVEENKTTQDNKSIKIYKQIKLPITIIDSNINSISVNINTDSLSEKYKGKNLITYLTGSTIFLVGSSGSPCNVIRQNENNIDIITSQEFADTDDVKQIITRIGNLSQLEITEESDEYGIFSKLAYFESLKYIGDSLLLQDDSNNIATTSWVQSLIPKGTIIAYNGDPSLLSAWHVCDGTNGTPNLIDKFIKASSNIEEGKLISLETTDDPDASKIELNYYSLIFIMKIV